MASEKVIQSIDYSEGRLESSISLKAQKVDYIELDKFDIFSHTCFSEPKMEHLVLNFINEVSLIQNVVIKGWFLAKIFRYLQVDNKNNELER